MDNLKTKLRLDSLRLKAGLHPLWGREERLKGKKSDPGTALVTVEKPVVVEEPTPEVTPRNIADAIFDIRDSMKAQEGRGEVNTYNLSLTQEIKEKEFRHPITKELKPLLTATIYNKGPAPSYFRINYPSSRIITLEEKDQVELDFKKDKRKFERVFYYTGPGSVSLARLVGKF